MAPNTKIHLVNPFLDPHGGSEQRTLALFDMLSSSTKVALWSEGTPHASFARFPIQTISPFARRYPAGGTVVLVGAYFRAGSWIAHTNAGRVVLVYNTYAHEQLYGVLQYYRDLGIEPVELLFASRALRASCCLDGIVQISPVDVRRFAPSFPDARGQFSRPFTIGRMSRDFSSKHHPSDPGIYRELVRAGCKIRIMGGTCLRNVLGNDPGVELLPAGAEEPESFLRSLNCFLYRTGDDWHETFGRVVLEAMACGLPVVVHRSGDYSEYVEHGRTGFVFQTDEDAIRMVLQLKQDPDLRSEMGRAAADAAKSMMREVTENIRAYFLG